MEPITLILGALAAGAVAATQETAGQMIKDAYAGLKTLIKRRFSEKQKPEIHKVVEIIEAAETLKQAMERTPERREALSGYIHIQNSQVGVIGDNTTVKGGIYFGGKIQRGTA